MGQILKWTGRTKKPEFEETLVLVEDTQGGPLRKMVLKYNKCVHRIDSGDRPVVFLNDLNISDQVVGVVSCSVNPLSIDDNWVDYAYVLTEHGMIRLRGVEPSDLVKCGYIGSVLPLWHLQRAADLNAPVAPEYAQVAARECMGKLKEFCEYVHLSESKVYEYNAGLIV